MAVLACGVIFARSVHRELLYSRAGKGDCPTMMSQPPNPSMPPTRRELLRGACAISLLALASDSAAVADENKLVFEVVGDWGRGTDDQRRVATAMAKVARDLNCRFVISTGDNFYPSGVSGVEDPRWAKDFESVYSETSLMGPWYSVLGNHDHKGSTAAQIAYSWRSPRWNMPAAYYSRTQHLGGGVIAEFFFLDTTPLADADDALAFLWASARKQQLAWLDSALANSRARWKFVIGHHPVFSGGTHGSTPVLIRELKPILERHKVPAYLNGHDHDLQHVEMNTVNYFTSGSGSQSRPVKRIDGTVFSSASLGFIAVEMSASKALVSFFDGSGKTIHSATLV